MTFLKKALTVTATLVCCAAAQAELKVATVNVQKLFADYYKTHEAQKDINSKTSILEKANAERTAQIQEGQKVFEGLKGKIQDTTANEKERAELIKTAEAKQAEVVALESTRRSFVERQLKSLQETMKQRSARLMNDINELTKKHAETAGYDIVIDSSAQSLKSNNVFMYTKPSMDITPVLLKELNKEAPADFDPSKPPVAPNAPAPNAPAPDQTPVQMQ